MLLTALICHADARAQTVTQRGLVEARGQVFPQSAPNDPTQGMADLLVREEVFVKPAPWLDLAAGFDLRASSHDQVDARWTLDVADRGARRPRLALRRATATMARGPFTIDVGKQFIRWGKTDILNPTDRFAPRDFLNVIDADFLAVTAARLVVQAGKRDGFDVVWVPRFTPSRLPLLNQRWNALPADAPEIELLDSGAIFPRGAQTGLRWSHVGDRVEFSASLFDGFNHLPNIAASIVENDRNDPAAGQVLPPHVAITRLYPSIRTYGVDAALPVPWLTIKAEAAYFTSSSADTDEYVLYVIQLERQSGEWLVLGGYAGQGVTRRRSPVAFAPDRGLTDAVVGRASYTIDANRSVAIEMAVRRTLAGAYGKIEYSQARGQHWRATAGCVIVRGDRDDFLGQYRRNSNIVLSLRYSF